MVNGVVFVILVVIRLAKKTVPARIGEFLDNLCCLGDIYNSNKSLCLLVYDECIQSRHVNYIPPLRVGM